MASKINFSALTFTAEQVRDLNELIFLSIVDTEVFANYHTIVPGIVYDKKIGFIGELGLVGKAAQDCEPTADTPTSLASEKTWTPKEWEVILDECFSDIEATLAVYALKFGSEKSDLIGTEYFKLVEELLIKAIQKMLWRISWFGDTAAANVDDSPAGKLTSGINEAYFNILDGFWKQIDTIFATTPARRSTIAANTSATYALQASDFTGALAYAALQNVKYNAHSALRAKANKVVYATRSVVDKLEQYLIGQGITPMYENLVNGFDFNTPSLKVLGLNVQPIDIWDEIITAYYDNGTIYYRPHRIVMTTKENLLVGVPSTGVIDNLDISYDKRSRINRIEARDGMCPLIKEDHMIQVAL